MPIHPIPCALCGGSGGGGPEIDTETVVLCDILPNGTIAGAAIAVYEYDEATGLPIGAPTFVIPGTNTPYVPVGILQPCDEPCLKCEAQILCDNTTVPASEVVASTMVMLDTPNVVGADGWNVTAYNTGNVTSVQLGQGCPSGTGPPLPVPYPAFYMADWCAAYLAACGTATAGGSGCALNPGPALGVTSNAEGVGCAGGPTFDTACARYLVEKTFNTDAACTKIRVTSQRFRADGSAKVLIDGQDTGIYGQYNVSSPDGTITLTVAPGPHTMTIDLRDAGSPTWIQGGLTIECLDIVPASTTSVEFIRTTCRTCSGVIVGTPTDTTLDGVTPYVPGPNVTICGAGGATVPCTTCDTQVLVDTITDLSGNVFCSYFLRKYCTACDGSLATVKDTLLDGTSPYTPTGTVSDECGGPSSEELLCDFGGVGGIVEFVRTFVKNSAGVVVGFHDAKVDNGSVYTVVGPVGVCRDTGFHATTQTLCDNNGPFIREFVFDNIGSPVATADFTLGGANYLAVGTVKVCPEAIELNGFDVEVEQLCDANSARFLRRYVYNSDTGAFASITDTTLDGTTPFAPVGAVSACPGCCPVVLGEGCATGGRRWASIRAVDGTISLVNLADGSAVLAADVRSCGLLNSQMKDLPANTAWTPADVTAGSALTSVTFTVISGTATVTDFNGTVVATIPAGYTGTWNSDAEDVLTGPNSILAVAGSRVLVLWTERA